MRKCIGDGPHHGSGRFERDLKFTGTFTHGRNQRFPPEVTDPCAFSNECQFLIGLHHAHAHGGFAKVNERNPWQCVFELGSVLNCHVIEFNTNRRRLG